MKFVAVLVAGAALVLTGCDGKGDAGPTAVTNSGIVPAGAPGGAPASANWAETVVATPEGGFRMGNPNAPVKLVEFGSMTCHVCRDFSKDATAPLEDNYVKSGQVSYEFRNFVRDQYDIVASLLARCGGAAPFFKLTEQMYTEQDAFIAKAQAISEADIKAWGALPMSQQLVKVAEAMGLDKFVGMRGIPAAKAQACMTNEAELNGLVERTQSAAKQYNIQGTPTFLINGKPVDPPTSTNVSFWQDLEPKLKAAIGG